MAHIAAPNQEVWYKAANGSDEEAEEKHKE